MADDNVQPKDEIPGRALLANLAVHSGFDRDPSPGVEPADHNRSHSAEGIEALGARPLPVFFLQVARGYVVDASVAEDVRAHIVVGAEVAAAHGDDHAEFAFIVNS